MQENCYENTESYFQLYQVILKDSSKFQNIMLEWSNFSFESDIPRKQKK